MRRSVVVALTVVAVTALAACGSSTGSANSRGTSPSTTSANEFSSPTYTKAGPNPSVSAKMVCEKEAEEDIAASLGVTQTSVTKPTWVEAQHLFSCTYVYPHGKITLAVKEMSSADETTAYYNSLQKKYGATQQLDGLGQGAWVLKNNDVVARKDYKVLLVGVTGIPANFVPAMTRSDVAINVANAIMGCWTDS